MKIISRINEEMFWDELKKQMSDKLCRFQELQTSYKNWAKTFFNVKLDKIDINNLVVSDNPEVYEPIIECCGLSRYDFKNHRTLGYIACLISENYSCLKNKKWFSYLDQLTNSDFTLFIRTLHQKESTIGKYFIEDGTHRLLSKLIFGDKLNADNLKCYMASNKCNFYYKLHYV